MQQSTGEGWRGEQPSTLKVHHERSELPRQARSPFLETLVHEPYVRPKPHSAAEITAHRFQ